MLDLLIHADELATFTNEELRQKGHSLYEIAGAVQDGYLVVVGTIKTGLPGRPAYKIQLTAKGARKVAKVKKAHEIAAAIEAKRNLEERENKL